MKFIKNHPLTAVLYVKMAKVHNGVSPSTVKIEVDGHKVGFKYDCSNCELSIVVDKKIHLKAGSVLNVEIK